MSLTIVADDLTGACDTGSLFAADGPVPLAIWPAAPSRAAVRVVDTESRATSEDDAAARAEGLTVFGPLPADTLFSRGRGGEFDIVVAMYHDQGHVPVKTLGFTYDAASGQWTGLSGVNVTVGLPFLRVSVDHGTAFDRAWKGIANHESMVEAIDVAVRMLTASGGFHG